jgi:6-pyruvoyltetrahydropterin/6-carboxytetrahydropterin synthase
MAKITITKRFENNKAAHRQWRHKGHCSMVHGENWTFDVTFSCLKTDDCGFVIDFGKMKYIYDWFTENFDHVLLIDSDDPEKQYFVEMNTRNFARVRLVPSASAEGLAKLVFGDLDSLVGHETKGRVRIEKVVCFEDSKNSAMYGR